MLLARQLEPATALLQIFSLNKGFDPAFDIVTNLSCLFDTLIFGIGKRPVLTFETGDEWALVTAAHCHEETPA